MTKTKRCTGCRTEKPIDDFAMDRQRGDGLQPYCRVCQSVRKRVYMRTEAGRAASRRYNESKYGRERHSRYDASPRRRAQRERARGGEPL